MLLGILTLTVTDMDKLPDAMAIPWRDIEVSLNLTVAKLREAVQNKMFTSGPGDNLKYMPTTDELDVILEHSRDAFRKGQVIDFGHWSNDFIKECTLRAKSLYREGALGHPFSTPWIFIHTWEDKSAFEKFGLERQAAAYLINPYPAENHLGWTFEVLELDSMRIKSINAHLIFVGDRCLVAPDKNSNGFDCQIIPAYKRFEETIREHMENFTDEQAASNVIDPTMTALLILNTRNVTAEIVRASDKLNKARERNKKPIIPPYRRIDSSTYVTAIMTKPVHHEHSDEHGTHASPRPHIRKGHWRNYKSGIRSFIRDTLVNVKDETREVFIRSHYTLK
jgi:hypothetical protein